MSSSTMPLKSGAAAPAPDTDSITRNERLLSLLAGDLRALPVLAGLALLFLFFASQSDAFLTSRNISNLIVQTVVTGVLALGLVFVLLLGEIDLSVAATSGVASVLMAKLVVEAEINMWLAVAAAIAFGAIVGTIIGFWRTRFEVPSFVVTLGAGLILTGLQLFLLPQSGRYNLLNTGVDKIADTYITGLASLLVALVPVVGMAVLRFSTYRRKVAQGISASLRRDVIVPIVIITGVALFLVWLANGYRGIPMPVIIFGVLLAVAAYFVTETGFGIHLYAVGGNEEAALRAGIKVTRVKIMSFAIAGALAAVAGIIAASRILGVSVSSGGGAGGGTLLLEAIAAAVIGGVSLFGGRGTVTAALLGALIIGTVSNGLNLMGVDAQVKYIVTGFLLILAVTLDRFIERRTSVGGR